MKECSSCGEEKPLTEYYKNKAGKNGYEPSCKDCKSEYYQKNKGALSAKQKERYSKNKEHILSRNNAYRQRNKVAVDAYQKEYRLKSRYNLTLEQYNQMLEEQNNACAICKEVNTGVRSLHIDHDHSCCPGEKSCGKCVRQLLCHGCNILIGYAKDDITILKASIDYINKHSPTTNKG